MDEGIEQEDYKGYTIKVYYDEDPMNPRTEQDHVGVMVCAHRSYNLGDVQVHSADEVEEHLKEHGAVVQLNLYLMDHGGISMSTGSFGDPWDSGQVGVIYLTRETIRKEWGWTRITKARRSQLIKYLEAEVEEYDAYISGQVYGYTIENLAGEQLDSCWGFYGETDYMLREARAIVDGYEVTDKLNAEKYELSGGGMV